MKLIFIRVRKIRNKIITHQLYIYTDFTKIKNILGMFSMLYIIINKHTYCYLTKLTYLYIIIKRT